MHEALFVPSVPKPGNGNGPKMNLRLEMLEAMLSAAHRELGSCAGLSTTSAKINSLKQAIRRNKTDMADTTSKSLEVLRQVFQSEINAEIQQIIDRHLRTTFSPAFENLKRSGYEVTAADINTLCLSILEGAKESFPSGVGNRLDAPSAANICIPACAVLKGFGSRTNAHPLSVITSVHPQATTATLLSGSQADRGEAMRRQIYELSDQEDDEYEGNSDAASMVSSRDSASVGGSRSGTGQWGSSAGKPRGRPRKAEVDSGRSGTPLLRGTTPVAAMDAIRWNPERIRLGEATHFVLASRLYKALGSGIRGHIFGKYPLAPRYIGDEEDRAWLLERSITNRQSGKIFVMLLDDALAIAEREGTNAQHVSQLHRCAFSLPDTIAVKIKQKMSNGYNALLGRVVASTPTAPHSYGHEQSTTTAPYSAFSDIPT